MTSQNPADFSRLIERCVVESAWIKAESKITDQPDIFKIENSFDPKQYLNGIYRTQFVEDNPVQRVAKEHLEFAQQNLPFRWYAYSHSSPHNLDELLLAHKPTSVTEAEGLFLPTDAELPEIANNVEVEELAAHNIEDYALACLEGWGNSAQGTKIFAAEIKKDFEQGRMAYRYFVARYRGEPASTGILRVVKGCGYLLGGSTRPQFRNLGIYRSLIRYRIERLKAQGIALALVLARKESSAPVCKKIGFKVGSECRSYEFSFK